MTDHVIIALKGITLVNPAIGNYRHDAVRQMALETSCLLSADDAPLRATTLIAAAIPFQRHSCHHIMALHLPMAHSSAANQADSVVAFALVDADPACRLAHVLGEAGIDLRILAKTTQSIIEKNIPIENGEGCTIAHVHATLLAPEALLQ